MEHVPKSISQTPAAKVSQQVWQGSTLPETFQFKDNRPEVFTQRNIQSLADESTTNPASAQLKTIVGNPVNTIQKKANTTGMPDNIKSGVENLSGMDMSDVKVHYNSSQPAQLNAHAYAQGTNIHIAPGQEKHLPHEAWHVVQQKQGRVKPTVQMKKGVAVNDDKGLEKEADVMGSRALSTTQLMAGSILTRTANTADLELSATPIQRYRNSGAYMISENDRFAVTGHGTPHSMMYIQSMGHIANIQHIEFEQGAGIVIDGSRYITLRPKYKSPEDKLAMEKMYCGQFAHHVKGKRETQESGDAPAGRSLYMKISGPASVWENHYAPVIIVDGGDRGTFETAVGLDFLFFGIYGQQVNQSFAFKTEIAGMILGLEKDELGKGLQYQIDSRAPGTPIPDYLTKAIKSHELEKEKARGILYALETAGSERKGDRSESEIESFLEKIKAHQVKRYDLAQELENERNEQRAEQVRQAQVAQRKKEKAQKIAAVTVAIVVILVVLLAIFL